MRLRGRCGRSAHWGLFQMFSCFRFQIRSPTGNSGPFFSFWNPSRSKIPASFKPMLIQSGSAKRLQCPLCCKPARNCICNRFQTGTLDNSVAVMILQHSLEKKHPLNSSRIARIGLKNVDVVTVSDVQFEAGFFVKLLDSMKWDDGGNLFDEMRIGENEEDMERRAIMGNEESVTGEVCIEGSNWAGDKRNQIFENAMALSAEIYSSSLRSSLPNAFHFSIGKYGAISSLSDWIVPQEYQLMPLDDLLGYDHRAIGDATKGFIVKRLQKKQAEGGNADEEIQEFKIIIPPGSVLLFPNERAVDFEAVNFKVKNLIVLDGTWGKAKRMYSENPWLRLLPHVKLDVDKQSLYGEVRDQPKAGYLSTIESIVYAMKALGNDSEGLDGLLDVFESMVGDQRRCKNERLKNMSEKEKLIN